MKQNRKILVFVIILLIPITFAFYKIINNHINTLEKDNIIFYTGQSDNWIATYTITKVDSYYYDSLCIQYLYHHHVNDVENHEKIGPIEYKLVGNSMEIRSSYPQQLKGVANFHVGSVTNGEVIQINIDDELELTVKWKDKTEILKLKRN